MIKHHIKTVLARENLDATACQQAIEALLNETDPYQAAAFLALLTAKGETQDELYAICQTMRAYERSVHVDRAVMEVVGTGGDGSNTFNISTAACLMLASLGVDVLKHGNRSISSLCGSADLLEALGIPLADSGEQVIEQLNQHHFAFCFAPHFHPAFAKVKPLRQAIGIKTVFNLLGPLLNPAHATYQMIGLYTDAKLKLIADVLQRLGTQRTLVFHSNGVDELTTCAPAKAILVEPHTQTKSIIEPAQYGFARAQLSDLTGGNAKDNACLIHSIFSGVPSPAADTVILNAGVGLWVRGVVDTIESGVDRVKQHVANGLANTYLASLVRT